jgi:hypothetical protein
MTVQVVWESDREHGVTGVGYAQDGEVEDAGCAANVPRAEGLCCDARLVPPDPPGPPPSRSANSGPAPRREGPTLGLPEPDQRPCRYDRLRAMLGA